MMCALALTLSHTAKLLVVQSAVTDCIDPASIGSQYRMQQAARHKL